MPLQILRSNTVEELLTSGAVAVNCNEFYETVLTSGGTAASEDVNIGTVRG